MEDHNKVPLRETSREVVINFNEICRFCLVETKSGITINKAYLPQGSGGTEEKIICSLMTKLNFIKMENRRPLQVCKSCCSLIQVCYDFQQICQKSDNFLKDCYRSMKQSEPKLSQSEIKISEELENQDNLLNSNLKSQPNLFNNFPSVMCEINKHKNTILENLKQSIGILDSYKQKLGLSSKCVESQKNFTKPVLIPKETLKPNVRFKHLKYPCLHCSLSFSSLRALNFHYVAIHSQERFRTLFQFQCKNCKESFSTWEELKRHYLVIHKISEIYNDYLDNGVKQMIQIDKRKPFCFHCVSYKEFQSENELTQHLENSHKNQLMSKFFKLYACAYCNNLFSTRLNLNQHLLLVHKLKEDKITWKNVKFISFGQEFKLPVVPLNPVILKNNLQSQLSSLLEVFDSMVDSLKVVQQEKNFKILCKKCNPPAEFTSANEFVNHIHALHDESNLLKKWATKNSWNCSECSATYSRKQSLYYHMKEKHKQTNFGGMQCPEPDCPESFATNRQLIQHGIVAHQKYFAYFHKVFNNILQPEIENERTKNFECDFCQKKYIYKSSLRKHILTIHLGKAVKDTVVCSYCGKTISNKVNLKSHIEFIHEALFVSCPICKKKINFRTIGKHYKTHNATSDVVRSKNSFLCNLCGKILKSKRSFEDHQKLHKNIRDELCDVCGCGFTSKKFLQLHKKTHEAVQRKTFSCDQCEKVFSGRHTLNRHLLTHSGKKNFICEICSKCFYTLQELNRHVRYHKKEYRFDCQLCEMRFLDKSRFRHHMMSHRNVRPHKCQFCEKMFIVRGKMNLHMATKHNYEVRDGKGVWKDPKTYVPLDDLL